MLSSATAVPLVTAVPFAATAVPFVAVAIPFAAAVAPFAAAAVQFFLDSHVVLHRNRFVQRHVQNHVYPD